MKINKLPINRIYLRRLFKYKFLGIDFIPILEVHVLSVTDKAKFILKEEGSAIINIVQNIYYENGREYEQELKVKIRPVKLGRWKSKVNLSFSNEEITVEFERVKALKFETVLSLKLVN